MCLIFVALNQHPAYKLIVAANRDEFYNRRTAGAHYWEDFPHVLGGRDLEAGGTWLGMTTAGKLSMLTNFRDPANINPAAPSRGHLVSEYLENEVGAEDYLRLTEPKAGEYNGFNLLMGTVDHLWYLSNYGKGVEQLTDGIHGLSNSLLNIPWPKVSYGKEKLKSVLNQSSISMQALFELLYDDKVAADNLLPDTGIGLDRERALSSMFIKSPGYGSRCSTVIMVDHHGHVQFGERVYDLQTFDFTLSSFEFDIR